MCIVIAAGMEITTWPLAWASVKSFWAKSLGHMTSAVKIIASNPLAGNNSKPQPLLTSLKWYALLLVCHLTAHSSQTG